MPAGICLDFDIQLNRQLGAGGSSHFGRVCQSIPCIIVNNSELYAAKLDTSLDIVTTALEVGCGSSIGAFQKM
jgi:hypothetical protein